MMNEDLEAYAYELLTVASATVAVSLTSTVYYKISSLPVRKALVSVNPGVPIRYTIDGTTVTTGTGHAMTSYGQLEIWGHENIKNFRATSANSASTNSVSVTYFR